MANRLLRLGTQPKGEGDLITNHSLILHYQAHMCRSVSRRGQLSAIVLFLSCLLALAGCNPPIRSGELASSVVNIGLRGSGVVVGYEDGNAFILTAAHVMGSGENKRTEEILIFFRLDDYGAIIDTKMGIGKLVQRNDSLDLAGLRCEIPGEWAKVASVTVREWPVLGETLRTAGCPGGISSPTLREGIMGAWSYKPDRRRRGVFTGGVIGGCSGSGLYDSDGTVVGIIVEIGSYSIRKGQTEVVVVRDHHCGIYVPVNRELVAKFCRIGAAR